jgi:hypothetical protein
MYFFQLPRIPERLLMRRNGTMVSELLRRSGQTPDAADRDAQAMSETRSPDGSDQLVPCDTAV